MSHHVVRRVPGSIPCAHCLDDVEARMHSAIADKRDATVSSPGRVRGTWSAFRTDPGEHTWRPFVYRLAMLVGEAVFEEVIGDVDPWPQATKAELDRADSFWSFHDYPDVGSR